MSENIDGMSTEPNYKFICPITKLECDQECDEWLFSITCQEMAESYVRELVENAKGDRKSARADAILIKDKIGKDDKAVLAEDELAIRITEAAKAFELTPYVFANYIVEQISADTHN